MGNGWRAAADTTCGERRTRTIASRAGSRCLFIMESPSPAGIRYCCCGRFPRTVACRGADQGRRREPGPTPQVMLGAIALASQAEPLPGRPDSPDASNPAPTRKRSPACHTDQTHSVGTSDGGGVDIAVTARVNLPSRVLLAAAWSAMFASAAGAPRSGPSRAGVRGAPRAAYSHSDSVGSRYF